MKSILSFAVHNAHICVIVSARHISYSFLLIDMCWWISLSA